MELRFQSLNRGIRVLLPAIKMRDDPLLIDVTELMKSGQCRRWELNQRLEQQP